MLIWLAEILIQYFHSLNDHYVPSITDVLIQVISEDHYDIDTNTLHQRDGNRNTISYKFGTNGEILRYTDAVGNSYNSVFDNFGRLRQTTFPDGSSEGYAYDVVGRLSSLTKPSGQTISYTYDSDNNLVSVYLLCNRGVTMETTHMYIVYFIKLGNQILRKK